VLLLPLHHPLQVAEDGAVVDALAGGRLVLGVGQGYAATEFELFEVDRAQRPSRFEEGLRVIRQAWRDGRTGFTGRRYALPDGPFALRTDAPIYVGATGGQAVDRAVRLADGLISYVSKPADVAARYAALTGALDRHGRPRESFPFVLTGFAHVAADADTAWREAGPGFAYLESALAAGSGNPPISAADLDPAEYLVGSPEDVAGRLRALRDTVPFDHFAFWHRLPGLTMEQASTAQRLFATDVMPLIN
jgi:alkanesulfonate monooxygenase SsuD/methylene tetrahydromethanopterin reductase-like flavin-dependent oxidoreductase (luciferase family)